METEADLTADWYDTEEFTCQNCGSELNDDGICTNQQCEFSEVD